MPVTSPKSSSKRGSICPAWSTGSRNSNYGLVPQVVATQVARRMTRDRSYYVRQVSLRYRNPDNRPDAYEAEQLALFTKKPATETSRIIKVSGQELFRYMLPMFAEKSCLECHGDYDNAPLFVRQRFPRGHYSYNYQIGEVIGAVSVTIPISQLYREIGANLELDIAVRGLIFLIIIVIMGALIKKAIITPVTLLSATITRVTRTGSFAERLPQKSNDEIGLLIGAFNDMMEELQLKTLQSRESEERYSKFIEMARSAVVTLHGRRQDHHFEPEGGGTPRALPAGPSRRESFSPFWKAAKLSGKGLVNFLRDRQGRRRRGDDTAKAA